MVNIGPIGPPKFEDTVGYRNILVKYAEQLKQGMVYNSTCYTPNVDGRVTQLKDKGLDVFVGDTAFNACGVDVSGCFKVLFTRPKAQ